MVEYAVREWAGRAQVLSGGSGTAGGLRRWIERNRSHWTLAHDHTRYRLVDLITPCFASRHSRASRACGFDRVMTGTEGSHSPVDAAPAHAAELCGLGDAAWKRGNRYQAISHRRRLALAPRLRSSQAFSSSTAGLLGVGPVRAAFANREETPTRAGHHLPIAT